MTEEGWDVNEEYEKIFGSRERINLFDTEEEYNELRQFIIDQPMKTFITKSLPFEGIGLTVIKDKPIRKQFLIEKPQPLVQDKHYFFIKEDGVCDAKGYYNEELKYFFICKDSLVSYDTDLLYMINDKEKARDNFLNKICEEVKGYYKVLRDAKCRSASAAACYVLGYISDETFWRDSEGRLLSEVFPDIFSSPIQKKENKQNREQSSKKKQETPKKEKPIHKVVESNNIIKSTPKGRPPRYFYIIRENCGDRSCNAKGTYDKVNDKFIILSGSELANEVTSSYRFTASDIRRQKFIQLNCGNVKRGFKLKRDAVCNSPDEAACFVLGENANGWVVWKSKDGISLGSYISKVLI